MMMRASSRSCTAARYIVRIRTYARHANVTIYYYIIFALHIADDDALCYIYMTIIYVYSTYNILLYLKTINIYFIIRVQHHLQHSARTCTCALILILQHHITALQLVRQRGKSPDISAKYN